MTQLIDNFEREFRYLRLSVTDVCNFRCQYCLPQGYCATAKQKQPPLTLPEIRRVVQAFAQLGIEKIRLTGGEPTLRRDFSQILQVIQQQPEIKAIALTTNGYRLAQSIDDWQQQGLTALNVSIDSLDAKQFYDLTGHARLDSILNGVDRALALGIPQVKVNVVLLKGLNDHLAPYLSWIQDKPIQLRFIELMETGLGHDYFQRHHLSGQVLIEQLLATGWRPKRSERSAGPAQVFSHPDYQGQIGLIMPYAPSFCDSCNRLRISSQGHLHLCLFGESGIDLRDLLQEDEQLDALKARIKQALRQKRPKHFLHQHETGLTQNLSLIGG